MEVAEAFRKANNAEGFKKLTAADTPPEERMALMRSAEQLGGFFCDKTVPVLSLRDHPLSLDKGGAILVDAPSAGELLCFPDLHQPARVGVALKEIDSSRSFITVDFASEDFHAPIAPVSTNGDKQDDAHSPRTESQKLYYEEVEQLAVRLLGEDVVHAFCTSHILRESSGSDAVGSDAGPIKTVHNDFTEECELTRAVVPETHPAARLVFTCILTCLD